MKNIFLIGIMLSTLYSCGGKVRFAEWDYQQEMPSNISYDKAWGVIMNTALEDFEIDLVDPYSGYLQSKWKTLSVCWFGLFRGVAPCKKIRLSVQIFDKNPVRYSVKIETYERGRSKRIPSSRNDYTLASQFARRINDKLRREENETN